MIRILSGIQAPVFGGIHNMFLEMNEPMMSLGFKHIPAIPNDSKELVERMKTTFDEIIFINTQRPRKTFNPLIHLKFFIFFFFDVYKLCKIIQKNKIDIVQINGTLYLQLIIAAKLMRKKSVWHLHSDYYPKIIRIIILPFLCLLPSAIMTNGRRVGMVHFLDYLRIKYTLFFPPVNTKKFINNNIKREQARRLLGVNENDFVIGTVGNFNRQKNHPLLIKVFAKVKLKHPNVKLRILGQPTPSNTTYYNKEVIGLAESLKVDSDVKNVFINAGSKVQDFLPGFDLFAMSSVAEGATTTILEAMSCSIPSISTNVGSISEAITQDVGKIVDLDDFEGFIKAITEMIENYSTTKQMSLAARIHAEHNFDVSICVKKHASTYLSISKKVDLAAKE